jgi:hypothetical protein
MVKKERLQYSTLNVGETAGTCRECRDCHENGETFSRPHDSRETETIGENSRLVCITALQQFPPGQPPAVNIVVPNNRRMCAPSATVLHWRTSQHAGETAGVKRDVARQKHSCETH